MIGSLIGCGQPADRPAATAPIVQAKNLVLISLDTLRPDMLACYGYERPTSPNLDRLAGAGVLFESAMSVAPWTLPAHASLMTGLYPRHHGARQTSNPIASDTQTLAELLSSEGFATAALVSSKFVDRRYGFDRGFTYFDFLEPSHAPGSAFGVVDSALTWLRGREDGRFFLFVHDYYAHSAYTAPREIVQQFAKPYSGAMNGTTRQLKQVRMGRLQLNERDLEHLVDLYVSGVRQTDENVGRLLRGLGDLGLLESTLIVVTSDHGEEFMEHGSVLHGHTQHEEVLRIPLIMAGPGLPEGRRVNSPVSIIDVMPTALGLLGVRSGRVLDGIDLEPLYGSDTNGPANDRALFSEADHNNEEDDIARSVRRGDYKLLHDRLDGTSRLYDLSRDPWETEDLYDRRPEISARLEEHLSEFEKSAIDSETLPPLSEREIEDLRALGYLEMGPPVPKPRDAAAP